MQAPVRISQIYDVISTYLSRGVKGASKDFITFSIEMKTDDFSSVALKRSDFLASLDIPEFGIVIHGASGDEVALGSELETHNF